LGAGLPEPCRGKREIIAIRQGAVDEFLQDGIMIFPPPAD